MRSKHIVSFICAFKKLISGVSIVFRRESLWSDTFVEVWCSKVWSISPPSLYTTFILNLGGGRSFTPNSCKKSGVVAHVPLLWHVCACCICAYVYSYSTNHRLRGWRIHCYESPLCKTLALNRGWTFSPGWLILRILRYLLRSSF